jgi:SAM-dependent methyltransferase
MIEKKLEDLRNSRSPNAVEGLIMFNKLLSANSDIIDVGSGPAEDHAGILRDYGHNVDTCDFHDAATYKGNFNEVDIDKKYDGVWSAHCLEHQLNVNSYLKKIGSITKEGGVICITVPPLKHTIVGGHVSLWNAGLLLYNLVVAGFDCTDAKVFHYGYNISAIVKKKSFEMPELKFIGTDLGILRPYFPKNLVWKKNGSRPRFDGDFKSLNWNNTW